MAVFAAGYYKHCDNQGEEKFDKFHDVIWVGLIEIRRCYFMFLFINA